MASSFPDDPFLEELLRTGSVPASSVGTSRTPIPERDLLRAANAAGTPTLRSNDATTDAGASTTFGNEIIEIVRKHPIPTLAGAAALAFLLTRRRR